MPQCTIYQCEVPFFMVKYWAVHCYWGAGTAAPSLLPQKQQLLKKGQVSQLGQLGFSCHCQLWQGSQTRDLNFTYIIHSFCINSFLSAFTASANICGYHIAYCLAKLASDHNWGEFREKQYNGFATDSSGNDIPRNRAQLLEDPERYHCLLTPHA